VKTSTGYLLRHSILVVFDLNRGDGLAPADRLSDAGGELYPADLGS
jgi:hypothetical protein